jgi:sarcosine oxidase subunit beta
MVIDHQSGFHFRPVSGSANDVLLAAPSGKFSAAQTGLDVDEGFIADTCTHAEARADFLCGVTVDRQKCRAGYYEMSPDHHAILGASGVDGLYLANGFSGHGVMHSPAAGRAVAEEIVDGKATFMDSSELGIGRFGEGKVLRAETGFV